MAVVIISRDAQTDFNSLPLTMKTRVSEIFARLEKWPAISGAKPLRHALAGKFRIRTGDYRVRFSVAGATVTIEKIGHRRDMYD